MTGIDQLLLKTRNACNDLFVAEGWIRLQPRLVVHLADMTIQQMRCADGSMSHGAALIKATGWVCQPSLGSTAKKRVTCNLLNWWMPDHQHTPDEIKNVKQFIEKYWYSTYTLVFQHSNGKSTMMEVDVSLSKNQWIFHLGLRCLGFSPLHSCYARAAENAALVCRDHQSGPVGETGWKVGETSSKKVKDVPLRSSASSLHLWCCWS